MTVLVNIVLFGALAYLLYQRSLTLLTYFQQEEYDGTRFVASCLDVRLYDVRATSATVLAVILMAFGVSSTLCLIALAAVFGGLAFIEGKYRYKKPLAKTQRAMQIFKLVAAVLILFALLVFVHPILAILAIQIAPIVMIAINAALKPFQDRINEGFVTQAREKLERLDPVRIGITGSFGKTTVKHMFAEILETSGPVFYSPGSINTVLGLTRHIRQRLQWSHRYFIAEMGAYGIGSIDRLCDFIHPQFGIVTAVGDAHTERFGSLDAIAQAKSELVANVCKTGGTMVMNVDVMKFEPFQALKEKYGAQIVTVGLQDADVLIEAVEIEGGAWSITLRSDDARIPSLTFELPLIGDHNVMNSALAVTMALLIDKSTVQQIPYFTKTIAQIPHRLQKIDVPGSALILDDAYNSNELGFMSAVSALDKLAQQRGGRRILVTPGIAELGLEHDRVHDRLGKYCATKCDLIYAVNPTRIETFCQSAKSETAKVFEVPTFSAARAEISKTLDKEDVVLYENDLPDLLEEKRFL
jgi:UDP-N-acetylmuramoyl-tripeptide--D-alanyl-D-alanine ligase